MAISNVEVRKTIDALRNLGGKCTLRTLATAINRDVNGLSQTLNGKTFQGVIIQEEGNGGDRFIRLADDIAEIGPLFSKKHET